MEIEDYSDMLPDIPENICPSQIMQNPNEEIQIFSGDYILRQGEDVVKVNGSIRFRWYPFTGVRFDGEVLELESIHESSIDLLEKVEIWIDDLLFGLGRIYNKTSGTSINFVGTCNQSHLGETNIAVNEIQFSIPNLREYFGDGIKRKEHNGIPSVYRGRQVFDNGVFEIIIDKVYNFTEQVKKLVFSGGYVNLYGGKVSKHKGSITLSEAQDFLFCFNNFLFFLNGRRTSMLFLKGQYEDTTVWSDYSPYHCDDYKSVTSWSDAYGIENINEMWVKFSEMSKDADKKDFLYSAIHWYVEANSNAGYIEGSIILAQTALELIYNWLLVEQKKVIIGNDASNISAANKFRLLLSHMNVDTKIPPRYVNLLSIEDVYDGPEIFTSIRNCLVHGQEKKRKELQSISTRAKLEALELGLWYIELSLLFILGHKGKYSNRASLNQWRDVGELVPWV